LTYIKSYSSRGGIAFLFWDKFDRSFTSIYTYNRGRVSYLLLFVYMFSAEHIIYVVGEHISYAINILWLIVITWWVIKAARSRLIDEYGMYIAKKLHAKKLMHVRRDLAIYLLLWLEFIVASDIIDTMLNLDRQKLILLWGLILIRIVVGYMLDKEITEYEKMKDKREKRASKQKKK